MSIVLAAILALGVTPGDGSTASNNSASNNSASANQPGATQATAKAQPRTGKELDAAVHETLAHWAKAKDLEVVAAGRVLLALYHEVVDDQSLTATQREKLRMSVRGRLIQLMPDIKRVADQRRIIEHRRAADESRAAAVKSVAGNGAPTVLAQQGVPQGFGQRGPAAGNQQNADFDYGLDLVDLIQTTISPKSWDVNGGNARIHYWRQKSALVVHANDDVQADISDTLDQLNRAGH